MPPRRCGRGRDPIDWNLATDPPIRSRSEAIEKLDWYALRWRVETYHKILKSGCGAEKLMLRTADRLVQLLAIFCILGWRIFWLTMMQRATQRAAPSLAFTALEVELLARTAAKADGAVLGTDLSLQECLTQLARLGGYLHRSSGGPPTTTVMWRGMARLTDIALGYEFAGGSCGVLRASPDGDV